jgi:hypothetical protein
MVVGKEASTMTFLGHQTFQNYKNHKRNLYITVNFNFSRIAYVNRFKKIPRGFVILSKTLKL